MTVMKCHLNIKPLASLGQADYDISACFILYSGVSDWSSSLSYYMFVLMTFVMNVLYCIVSNK